MEKGYITIANFYEECLEKHGATPQGVDWPNHTDLEKRFNVMLGLVTKESLASPFSLLDLGCGYGALVEYLNKNNLLTNLVYTGIDISPKMVNKAKELFPQQSFFKRDILKEPLEPSSVDYIIMNGLLTEKRELSWEEMKAFSCKIIKTAFNSCRKGIAFNIMSQHVDWSSLNLFHWSFDEVADFLIKNCTRHIVFRNDYGLYEYTVYAYKSPTL